MSDSEQEYEVESVTRARVHDKKGKKLTWKYYVKWKGYGWDECTWEPMEHFAAEAKLVIDAFWDRVDTGGRDIHNATLFKKGEEMFISGPPGKKSLKRKQSAAMIQHTSPTQKVSVSIPGANLSPPRTTPRKRRKVQKPYDDVLQSEEVKSQARTSRTKRRTSMTTQKGVRKTSPKVHRRRASSPGPRKVNSRRLPSVTDSELDAEGEIDPDIEVDTREVEDALMQSSVEDGDELLRKKGTDGNNRSVNGDVAAFDDIEHFHSGQPIEIEQPDSEDMEVMVPETPIAKHPSSQKHGSPTPSPPDPLFDSPPHAKATSRERSEDSAPLHRSRSTKPRIKVMEAPLPKTSTTAITAKARLMTMPTASTSGAVPVRATAKRGRGGKQGYGRLSANPLTKHRSSLLTVSRGKLTTVKGTFVAASSSRGPPEEIEEVPSTWDAGESGPAITTWSDGDAGEMDESRVSGTPVDPKPSGTELLKLAGMENDPALPDFDEEMPLEKLTEDSEAQPKVEAKQDKHAQPNDIIEDQTSGLVATAVTAAESTTDSGQTAAATNPATVTTTAEDNLKRNLALAKEQLFPSGPSNSPQKMPRSLFSETQTSFTSTIFGPLYQGTSNHSSSSEANQINSSTSLKIIVNDTVSIPITLEDVTHLQGDLRIGKSINGRAGNFYGENDALAIVHTLRSHGTARVVPDASADTEHKECFATFLNHFQSNRTFVSAAGVDVCVLYLSENIVVAEKLSTPSHLIGLGNTLLVSRASIENQSTYAQAAYAAQSVLS